MLNVIDIVRFTPMDGVHGLIIVQPIAFVESRQYGVETVRIELFPSCKSHVVELQWPCIVREDGEKGNDGTDEY